MGKLVLTYKNEFELSALLRELAFGEFDLHAKKGEHFYTDVESLSDIWSFQVSAIIQKPHQQGHLAYKSQ